MGIQSAPHDEGEVDERYGCACCKSRYMQFFNTIRWNVFWQCIFNFFEGFIVNGVINVVIPALEKRYELSSSKSALIASSNDFGGFVFYIPVAYFGEQSHKPKIMAVGMVLMSIGSFIFSLPHMIGDSYKYVVSSGIVNGTENMCVVAGNSTLNENCLVEAPENTSYNGFYACFLIGQVLLGIGAVPMFTIALTYIDENCKPKLTSLYISMTFCAAAVGVAAGYIVGGQTLSYFVDIDRVDMNTVPLTPADPQWVGAWWIGALMSLFAFFLVAWPLLGFPRRLPGYEELQKNRLNEVHGGAQDEALTRPNFGKSIKDFPKAIFMLLKNPAFVFVTLSATTEALLVGGFATFGAKILTEFFNIDLTKSGMAMGIITIPGAGGGMLLGGYLVKKFKMKFQQILKLMGASILICMLFAPSFLANCPSKDLAGVTTPYDVGSDVGLSSPCNADCGCSTEAYEPVCDSNFTEFFSPCHAGCKTYYSEENTKKYKDCSCLADPNGGATGGLCSETCPLYYVMCVLYFCIMLFTFTTMSPSVTATLRCVPNSQRSLALAVELLVVRLLGTTPGPVLLGAIIDSTCAVWQDTCGTQGSCWVYRKTELGVKLLIWLACIKCLGLVFVTIAYKVYKPPKEDKHFTDICSNKQDNVCSNKS